MPSGASLARLRVARRVVPLALAVVLAPAVAPAQVPLDQEGPRTRLRDRYHAPQSAQKLSDNVRKLQSDDPEQRLEAIELTAQPTYASTTFVGGPKHVPIRYRIRAAR